MLIQIPAVLDKTQLLEFRQELDAVAWADGRGSAGYLSQQVKRNQQLPEARSLIEKALEFSPGDPFITDSLGWVEFRLGNFGAALTHLQKAYKSRADAEIAAHLGEVLWRMKRQDEALKVWREGLATAPNNETLQETLQRLKPDL